MPGNPVAVIAIHGEGMPPRGDTARLLADSIARAANQRVLFEERTERIILKATQQAPVGVASVESNQMPAKPSPTVVLAGKVGGVSLSVHELHWADLSRDAPTTLSVVKQLLGVVPEFFTVSGREVRSANSKLVSRFYALAAFLLGWLLPVANAAILALVLSAIPFRVGAKHLTWISSGILVIISCVIGSLLVYRFARRRKWVGTLWIVCAAVLAASSRLSAEYFCGQRWACLVVLIASFSCGMLLVRLPLVRIVGRKTWRSDPLWIFLPMLGMLVRHACVTHDEGIRLAQTAIASTLNRAVSFVAVVWIASFLSLALLAPGYLLRRGDKGRQSRRLAWQINAGAFSIGVLVEALFLKLLRDAHLQELLGLIDPHQSISPYELASKTQFVFDVLQISAPLVLTLLLAGAIVVITFVYTPSVIAEFAEPGGNPYSEVRAQRQGTWLTAGRRRLSQYVSVSSCLAVFAPVCVTLFLLRDMTDRAAVEDWTGRFWAFALPSALAVLVALLRSPSTLLSIWPVLGLVLDVAAFVDKEGQPGPSRTAIHQRIRDVVDLVWESSPNATIVLVSHGVGVLPALELLVSDSERYRKATLVTLGAPLRLYLEILPTQFDQARRAVEEPNAYCRRWRNIYFAGDYVGRAMWAPEEEENTYSKTAFSDDRGFEDICAGEGAHMNYWTSALAGAEVWKAILKAAQDKP